MAISYSPAAALQMTLQMVLRKREDKKYFVGMKYLSYLF